MRNNLARTKLNVCSEAKLLGFSQIQQSAVGCICEGYAALEAVSLQRARDME